MSTPKKADKNTQLMKDCGSKTGRWDPEPPDQWKYQMYHGDAIARVVGWVKSKTTAYSLSPFAAEKKPNGELKPLTIKDLAKDLGWKHHTAINIVNEAVREGLIRIEKVTGNSRDPGRIYLCAEVPNIGRIKSDSRSFVQRTFPPYLVEQIERMSAPQREKLVATFQAFQKWSTEAMGDGVAELRAYIEQAEDSTLQAFGLEKKREVKRRVKKTAVRVELPEVPDFAQSVQSELCTKPETTNVQSEIQGDIKEADTDLKAAARTTQRKPAAAVSKTDVDRDRDAEAGDLAAALKQADPLITRASAKNLLSACRKRAPGYNPPVQVQEVLEVCSAIAQRKGGLNSAGWKAVKNPMGLFMSTVPESFPDVLAELRKKIA